MRDRVAAKRYAEALFRALKEKGDLEKAAAQLKAVINVFEKDDRLMQVLKSPKIDESRKREFIDKAFGAIASGIILGFIKLLVRKNRIDKIFHAASDFNELVDVELGFQEAEVVSVVPLDKEQVAKLKGILSSITKKEIDLKERIDKSILGGAVVKMGDTMIDGSVRNRLKKIRETLKAVSV